MQYITVEEYDKLIDLVVKPTGNPEADALCNTIAKTLQLLRDNYVHIAAELLAMYESAAEHNVDVSREAVYRLAHSMHHRS